jgi:UDP-glucuronate 4-epimerase
MAYFSFTLSILAGEPVPLFNHGRLQRDFTYIDDIIQGVLACIPLPPVPDASRAPHKIYNLGNRRAVSLEHFVAVLEDALQAKAKIEYLPMQPGDVFATCADIEESAKDLRFFPRVNIEEGLPRFVQWYREFYPL